MHTTSTTSRGRNGTRRWWRAEGATTAQPLPRRALPTGAGARRRTGASGFTGARGFTLTELLIVIGLIVLVISLAVPAFRAMSGGRSVDAAMNQLSAVLGAARAEAIGLQKVRGVFFYFDPAAGRVTAALVQEASPPQDAPANGPEYYLDLVPDRDGITLPVGVGFQGIDNAVVSGGDRKDDGYIGFNRFGDAPVRYGGVVLFDGYGRLLNKGYGLLLSEPVGKNMQPTRIAEALGFLPGGNVPAYMIARKGEDEPPPMSLFGFVLFDAESYAGAVPDPGGGDDERGQVGDPEPIGDTYDQDERDEEKWLDDNAVPVLINRYNGTLIRGE